MLESLRKNGAHRSRHGEAREALNKTSEVVELVDRAFELVAEDDPTQPAAKYLYAALCEAKIRANTLEDWYRRTYGPVVEGPRNDEARESRRPRVGKASER